MAVVAGTGRGRALVRNRCSALCHDIPGRRDPYRPGNQPGVGAAGISRARGHAAGCIDRRSDHGGLTLGTSSWYHSALPALLALFVLTFAATRFGRGKKQQLGVAEDKRGRNAAQVAANLGVAGLGAAVGLSHPTPDTLFAVVVVAAMAEATSDTLASELGEVLGGRPVLVTTLRRVTPGTDGAISLAGTVAGTSGAMLVVLVAVCTLGLRPGDALASGLGAVGGLFVDSLLGATAERLGWLNNDAVNFLSTLAASLIALAIFILR